MDALRSLVGLYKPDTEVLLGKLLVHVRVVMGSRNSDFNDTLSINLEFFPCKSFWF